MCFLVTEYCSKSRMRSRHDEEYRNGQEVNIDILDDSIWTPEWFRGYWVHIGVPGGYGNPPGKVMGHMGHKGRERAAHKGWRAPMGSSNWTRGGGAAPLSFPLSLSFPFPH